MKSTCVQEGCDKGIASGHALYRVSPIGEPFEGKCEEHFDGEPDPVAKIFEEDNLKGREA